MALNRINYGFLILFLVSVIVTDARAEMSDYPVVKLQSLDKITARTLTFDVRVGKTVKYGPLYIKVQACRKTSPIDQPESASFLQIWEVSAEEKANWVFSGWMFASSPALSAMNHPIYDVWVLDCLDAPVAKEDSQEKEINDPDEQEDVSSSSGNE